ncbi:MAG TPA: MFS transporter [Vicinamibacterales bacterium]|jgi:predicted MFS family arabinose efflux permease|nr:MFS transporter [Vicinamibacterales bacterium]
MRRLPTVPVMLAGFAAFVDLYATQPLLPLLARTFHASSFDVSLTITAPTVAVALAAPGIGRLADTLGLRRVIVGSAFAIAAATALAATSASLSQLIFWRFVQGLVTPGVFAGTVAYIHELWPATHSGRGTAAYMTGTIAGGFTGRAVAGLVAADASWTASFVALAAINLAVAAALAIWLPPDSRAARRAASERRSSSLGAHLRNPQLIATYAIGFCVLFTQVAMFTYVTFHLAAPPFSLSTVALGWLFVVYLVGIVVTPFGGRWIDRYGHRTGLALAMGIGAVGALLTLAPWLPAIVAGLALCSTGVFIAQAATSSYIGAVTTKDRALAVGLYSTFYYAGGSVGGAAPSAFWSRGGWPACVALIVLVQCAGVAIALTQWTAAKGALDRALPESGV